MCTVLRLCDLSDTDIESLGQQLEGILPGVFIGPDRGYAGRVSIEMPDFEDPRVQHACEWEFFPLAMRGEMTVNPRITGLTVVE
jgi:hypothetical protein